MIARQGPDTTRSENSGIFFICLKFETGTDAKLLWIFFFFFSLQSHLPKLRHDSVSFASFECLQGEDRCVEGRRGTLCLQCGKKRME